MVILTYCRDPVWRLDKVPEGQQVLHSSGLYGSVAEKHMKACLEFEKKAPEGLFLARSNQDKALEPQF